MSFVHHYRVGSVDAKLHGGGAESGHFRFRNSVVDFSYTLIRKNASSAMLRFFQQQSGRDRKPGKNRLADPTKFFGVNSKLAEESPCRLLILRDPVERLASLYMNRFAVRKLSSTRPLDDVILEACSITGRAPSEITPRIFVVEYLLSGMARDPHLQKQVSHLGPIKYNYVVMLSDLANLMISLLGNEEGALFKVPVNSTESKSKMRWSDFEVAAIQDWYSEDIELLNGITWRYPSD